MDECLRNIVRWTMGILSENVLKVTLSLKPHQMGMTENQGICSKVRWVMPKQDKIFPCIDVPFYSA